MNLGSRPTVLVADDAPEMAARVAELLTEAGAQVVASAADGVEALALFERAAPDAVVLDIEMPRLDGYQTCALIKKSPRFHEIPVIMLSSKDGLFDRARGRMVGSEQYLTKPFTKDSLLKAVVQHARRAAPSAAAGLSLVNP
jgi:twitching motility two-component system response regulator PilG